MMKPRKRWLLMLLLASVLVGCQTDVGVSPAEESRAETSAVELAMVTAALTGDPEKMADAVGVFAVCHGTVTCGSSYGSCSAWSSPIACGSQTCGGECGPRCPSSDPTCDRPLAIVQPREIYRVCFNSSGGSCTQWAPMTASYVGCGCEL